jgi:hypothetical protein
MKENLEKEIIDFIETEYWKSNLQSNSDIFETVRISGDDCFELIEKFSKKYNVDISNYLWYFHHEEEGSWNSIGGLIYKTPDKLVKRIPVTPKMLTQFAETKKWNFNYPYHQLPEKRKDILFNKIVLIITVILAFIGILINIL